MRIFVALEIPQRVRSRIIDFMEGIHEFAPQARWVKPESLHVTLKFIGEKAPAEVESIRQVLAEIQCAALEVVFRGCGFFPTARSARVFWVGIAKNPHLARLANLVEESCSKVGVAREEREFNPHLTLARAGSGTPHRMPGDRRNRTFEKLRERLAAVETMEFGAMRALEFALYQSKLSPKGAHYTALSRFPLAQL